MDRGLLVELSPHEEAALQQIAFGLDQAPLRHDHIARLKLLALIEARESVVVLTALGARRVATLHDGARPARRIHLRRAMHVELDGEI